MAYFHNDSACFFVEEAPKHVTTTFKIYLFKILELEGCESGKCSARGVCMCESASEWEVAMGLPWWCLLCKIVCFSLPSGASYVKT